LHVVALQRLAEAGVDPADADLGVIVAAAGSTDPRANAAVLDVASAWPGRARAAFACTEPGISVARQQLYAAGARRIAIASWFLAPGFLPDRVAASSSDIPMAAQLGAHELIAQLILRRYHHAVSCRASVSH
jgi:sirohydrochlorin ferrochelatase